MHVVVQRLVLHGGQDLDALEPEFVEHLPVIAMVLAEAAGPPARGHEEGALVRLESRPARRLDHVAGGERERVTLTARGVLPADAHRLVV
jgi:hypothetical protein